MIFAASNIAWTPDERLDAYALLAGKGAAGLEIAPALFLHASADPFAPTAAEIAAAKAEIADHGLSLVSMQSLLFGVEGAAMFEGPEARARFTAGMERAIDLAGALGLRNLVFGSPRQRVRPEGMSPEAAAETAAAILRPLADRAADKGCVIAMEFNPAAYGTNWLNRSIEALDFAGFADHPAITVNFDVGAMHMNEAFDGIEEALEAAAPLISHLHVSEPLLAPAPARAEDAARVLAALARIGYSRAVSIEMKRDEAGLDALAAALDRLAAARALAAEAA